MSRASQSKTTYTFCIRTHFILGQLIDYKQKIVELETQVGTERNKREELEQYIKNESKAKIETETADRSRWLCLEERIKKLEGKYCATQKYVLLGFYHKTWSFIS